MQDLTGKERPKAGKKIKKAAALKYSPEMDGAPRVIAAGRGETAERIVQTARRHRIPVYEDEETAEALSLLNIGDEIPEVLYDVIAEILVFVGYVDREYGESYGGNQG